MHPLNPHSVRYNVTLNKIEKLGTIPMNCLSLRAAELSTYAWGMIDVCAKVVVTIC